MDKPPGEWQSKTAIAPKDYVCGYCGNKVASNQGYYSAQGQIGEHLYIYLCPFCNRPTFFYLDKQTPGLSFGRVVKYIPSSDVTSLYDEARDCMKVNAYTASILCSRKLLMNIAVSKGAEEGKTFVAYVDYLKDKGFLPPDSKEWVDHIRKTGNMATHQIQIMGRTEAEELITFVEMLLKFIYEFPAMMKAKATPPTTT
jgi:hypothetical protein